MFYRDIHLTAVNFVLRTQAVSVSVIILKNLYFKYCVVITVVILKSLCHRQTLVQNRFQDFKIIQIPKST